MKPAEARRLLAMQRRRQASCCALQEGEPFVAIKHWLYCARHPATQEEDCATS
jgi:hypothetical protein